MRLRVDLENFRCHVCREQVHNPYSHYPTAHAGLLTFQCYVCNSQKRRLHTYSYIKSLVRHHLTFHQPESNARRAIRQLQEQQEAENDDDEVQFPMAEDDENYVTGTSQEDQMSEDEIPDEMPEIAPEPEASKENATTNSVQGAATTFMCGLLNEPSIAATHAFNIAGKVTAMYGPLIQYLQQEVLPSTTDPDRKSGNGYYMIVTIYYYSNLLDSYSNNI